MPVACADSARKEYAAAVGAFRRALEIDPDWAQAQHNLGLALFKLGQVDEALELFRRAATGVEPALPLSAIAVIIPGSPTSDNQAVLDARRNWAERELPPRRATEHASPRRKMGDRRPRIGYVSSFFPDHNWMKPVWGLINHHDRHRFEIHLFSDAPAARIQHGYRENQQDRFHDTSGLPNDALAQRIEEAGIDLLVDLNGYSTVRRLPLFAMRPARIIVGWFNMFATTGIPGYDYLIGDAVVIPPEEERFYCERIARVPGSYLTFEVTYPVPDVADPPFLSGTAITFGSLASQYKITNAAVAAWSTILKRVPNSSLILKNATLGSPDVRQFVHGLFERNDVAPPEGSSGRALGSLSFPRNLRRDRCRTRHVPLQWRHDDERGDLARRPVDNLHGRSVGLANKRLHSAGGRLGEFVGRDAEDYIALAISLANSPDRLAELRRNMRARLRGSPVCDTRSFARNMENLYAQMLAPC